MIKMEVLQKDNVKDSFIIRADEPMRMEVTVSENSNHLIAYAYEGVEIDLEQDPVGCYDSENEVNGDWETEGENKAVNMSAAKDKLSEEEFAMLENLLDKLK